MQEKQNYELAYVDYLKKMKYKEIAKKYNVSINTVKSWKSRHWQEKKVATKNKKGCTQKNKVGAPLQNKNAIGNGAPTGNKNARIHGIYEKVKYQYLTEEEKQLYNDLSFDEHIELKKQVVDCDIEIARLSKLLYEERNKVGGLSIASVTKTKGTNMGTSVNLMQTNTVATSEIILKITSEINKFQRQKSRCLESLIKFGYTARKLDKEIELMQIKIRESNKDLAEQEEQVVILDDIEEEAIID